MKNATHIVITHALPSTHRIPAIIGDSTSPVVIIPAARRIAGNNMMMINNSDSVKITNQCLRNTFTKFSPGFNCILQ